MPETTIQVDKAQRAQIRDWFRSYYFYGKNGPDPSRHDPTRAAHFILSSSENYPITEHPGWGWIKGFMGEMIYYTLFRNIINGSPYTIENESIRDLMRIGPEPVYYTDFTTRKFDADGMDLIV